jgi:hypothetical protein
MRHYLITLLIAFLLIGSYGCQSESGVEGDSVLMTVGQRELRQDEFQRAYRVYRSAHGAGLEEEPAVERASKLRFIHQLADQLVLLEYAHDIGLEISADALNQVVEGIRGDYPDDHFEQMLLENAINFEDWKEALRVRYVIDQLVRQELALNVQITEEDIASYYQKHASEQPAPQSTVEGAGTDQVDQMLIQQLRRQKTEEAYAPWMENLKIKYPVKIDQEVVKQIIADYDAPEDDGDATDQ